MCPDVEYLDLRNLLPIPYLNDFHVYLRLLPTPVSRYSSYFVIFQSLLFSPRETNTLKQLPNTCSLFVKFEQIMWFQKAYILQLRFTKKIKYNIFTLTPYFSTKSSLCIE